MLAELGYTVVEAASAEEALKLVSDGLKPDLLLTDHLMPGMSGTDLSRTLLGRWGRLPVVVVSGYAESEGIAPDLPRLTNPFATTNLKAASPRFPNPTSSFSGSLA
jgi:CheY-like chemotaxis protein